MSDIAVRVDEGLGWLDAVYPEWADHVKTGLLDLASSCDCVLGQVFRGGVYGLFGYYNVEHIYDIAGFLTYEDPSFTVWMTEHGFESTYRDDDKYELTERWISVIQDRQQPEPHCEDGVCAECGS